MLLRDALSQINKNIFGKQKKKLSTLILLDVYMLFQKTDRLARKSITVYVQKKLSKSLMEIKKKECILLEDGASD